MELLAIAAIVLAGSIVESFFSVLFGRQPSTKAQDEPIDSLTELRYSRLGSEYDTIEAA